MISTTRQGKPLRFLVTVMLCWTGGRLVLGMDWRLPPDAPVLIAIAPPTPALRHRPATRHYMPPHAARTQVATLRPKRALPPAALSAPESAPPMGRSPVNILDFIRFNVAYANRHYGGETVLANYTPGQAVAVIPGGAAIAPPDPATPDRWRSSGWLLWRAGGSGNALAGGGQLGGSQAGFRIDRSILPGGVGRLAAYARMTAAIERPHAPEAAIGLAWQPDRAVPVRIGVERRIRLGDGARDAFAIVAAGGIGPVDLPAGMTLEGYGQAGMVGLHRRDAFVDGRMALLHPLGHTPLSAGLSLSGGAQPQVARLDIGPAIEARLPLAGQPARLIAEWRERVAGKAQPGSGVAVTLAADF